MPKKSWNAFVEAHPRSFCAVTVFRTVPSLGLAKDGREVPSPYAILLDNLKTMAAGDWAARTEKKKDRTLVHLVFVEKDDLDKLGKLFTLHKNPKLTQPPAPCAELYEFNYSTEIYKNFLQNADYV